MKPHPSGLVPRKGLIPPPHREQAHPLRQKKEPRARIEKPQGKAVSTARKPTPAGKVAQLAATTPEAPSASNPVTRKSAPPPRDVVLERVWGELLPRILNRGGPALRRDFTNALDQVVAEQDVQPKPGRRPARSKINNTARTTGPGSVMRL